MTHHRQFARQQGQSATASTLGLLFSCQLTGFVDAGLAAGCRRIITTFGHELRGELPCDLHPPLFVFRLLSVPAEELLEFGLKRIEKFEHVGTTEKLYPSVEAAAASLKMPLGSTAYGAGEVGRVLARHSSSMCCVVCCLVCAVVCRAAVYRGVNMCRGTGSWYCMPWVPCTPYASRASLARHHCGCVSPPTLAPAAVCQAASANTEHSRSLTWQDAMKAGATPVPPSEDEVYAGGALCVAP